LEERPRPDAGAVNDVERRYDIGLVPLADHLAGLVTTGLWMLCGASLIGLLSSSSAPQLLLFGLLAAVTGVLAIGRLLPPPAPAMRVVRVSGSPVGAVDRSSGSS
jgi:hypothetical protein